jgi:hypothetical protein
MTPETMTMVTTNVELPACWRCGWSGPAVVVMYPSVTGPMFACASCGFASFSAHSIQDVRDTSERGLAGPMENRHERRRRAVLARKRKR